MPSLSFRERYAKEVQRARRARYTLRTDITEFYGSIYTHALEWALAGKAASKAHLHGGGGGVLPGADFDRFLRAGQEGQTKGVPISPDTSLLAAEVLLCAADADLVTILPAAATSASRYVDDYHYYASSRAEAEDALMTLDGVLSTYELALNPRKTEIIDGPPPPQASWKVNLSKASLRRSSATKLTNDLYALFSIAFEQARAFPDESIMGYAIQMTRPTPRGADPWQALTDLMSAAVMMDPSALRYMAARLDAGRVMGMTVDRTQLAETIDSVLLYHAPLAHGSEVAWALSMARDFDCEVTSDAAREVVKMDDNCALLLLRDLEACGQINFPVPSFTDVVARADAAGASVSEDWLLGYESCRLGWSSGFDFKASPTWSHLLARNVAFYDAKAAPSRPPAPRRMPLRGPFGYS